MSASDTPKEPRMTSYEEDIARLELAAARRSGQGRASRNMACVAPRDCLVRAGRILRRDLGDMEDVFLGVLYRWGLLALVLSPVILAVLLWKWLA